jgi:hypothetical protein
VDYQPYFSASTLKYLVYNYLLAQTYLNFGDPINNSEYIEKYQIIAQKGWKNPIMAK